MIGDDGRPAPDLPEVPGVLSAAQVAATGAHIAAAQWPDGGIPWHTGAHLDPWDHVEAAMALTVVGRVDAARRAYAWSAAHQRPDGSWPMRTQDGRVTCAVADTNQCAYLAVGLWHFWRVTGDEALVTAMWPTLERAVGFVLAQQQPGGPVAWAVSPDGRPAPEALLTGSASVHQSLRLAAALAEARGRPEPAWELAAARLGHAVRHHEDLFADRSAYAMDWYYPVLGGALTGAAARERLAAGRSSFVVPGRGVRCVRTRPWVTVAESCELVLALDACGEADAAHRVFADVQALRSADGGYWTGRVVPDEAVWPVQLTTWTAATVVLAADALSRTSPGNGVFRVDDRGVPADWTDGLCNCPAVGDAVGR